MIKYKTIKEFNGIGWMSFQESCSHRNKYPVHYIYKEGEESWTIPFNNNSGWILHRDEGPAVLNGNGIIGRNEYYFYGICAKTKEEFYNKEWRRKIEIKRFL